MKKRVIDTHCDTLMEYCKNYKGFKEGPWNVTYDKMKTYDSYLGTFAMYFSAMDTQEQRREQAALYRMAYKDLCSNYDIKTIKNQADLDWIDANGGPGILLSIENACFIEDDFREIAEYWDLGVRMISLTHFADSQYGCGNATNDTPEKDTGLTERGKKMVQLAELAGMIFDVSHLSFKSFWDVVEVTKKPFIASHSNSHAMCDHGRNLTDEMFKVIIERGGMAGMCFCPPFVAKTETTTVQQMADHVEHFCSLGGEKNICMGGDLDGIGSIMVQGLEDASKTWNLAEELLKRNYSEEQVEGFMWKNAFNLFKKLLPAE